MIINGEEHNDLCVGIDLGTTNSVLATVNLKANGDIVSRVVNLPRAVDMYSMGLGSNFTMKNLPTLPSCVYYNVERNFSPVVGDFAKSRYSLRPHLVAKSIKSQMGNELAKGLSADIPDKTPAEISSRILSHMLNGAARIYHQSAINDAVITVPASFDSIMCQATLRAAELAGINIRRKDGTIRSILLPEPQAVIYDFINQVHNGEIAAQILDLSSEKIVMVFDLGGGTLDITLHRISRRKDMPDVLSVEDLAINRYTLLGGDDFDTALAKEMFLRYLKKYVAHPQIVQKIKHEESSVMAQLLSYAEDLKIHVSMDKSGAFGDINSSDAWGDEDIDNYTVGGGIGATGFAYDDAFTIQELENVWEKFMGKNLSFDDFKRLDEISAEQNTQNIIFPILDVLKKCANKLGTEDFKIDAVIMNGGMSLFYMVTERLKKFFGFDPIVALDPDQAVARGAAVYHYFLHKYDEKAFINETAPYLPKTLDADKKSVKNPEKISSTKNVPEVEKSPEPIPYIAPMKFILPDSLYLATAGNHYEEIISTGTELPHQSKKFTGFKLPAGTNRISIPIARRDLNGTHKIIAKGNILFPAQNISSGKDIFVAFNVSMNAQKIIRMDAWTCRDFQGDKVIDKGATEILVATGMESPLNRVTTEGTQIAPKIFPNSGKKLNATMILKDILNLCRQTEKAQKNNDQKSVSKWAKQIREKKTEIFTASNPEDFAEPLLDLFGNNQNLELFKMTCIIIGRKIGAVWTNSQKRRLANLCWDQVAGEMHFITWEPSGPAVNTKIQAIYTLYMCASHDDLEQMQGLHRYDKFRIANLYTHAMTKTDVDWIYAEFRKDYNKAKRGTPSKIQISAHALGLAFRLGDNKKTIASVSKKQIINELCELISSHNMNSVEIGNCIIALGLLCDQRYHNTLDSKSVLKTQKLLGDLKDSGLAFLQFAKATEVAQKMIEGGELSADEEEFLLIKVDD